ncbi:hypothetical protein FF011L_35050 [Roseimaritima multifibrata]|uniref:Uncharacterized protein n=1 Tax=Roseimaritima multifibrata TaxID=1930274 RepID=A0A517MIQ2_9BACT|nr:hypothetical protein FF011L_35050 [Roseimaritima multifibrata]
MTRDTVNVRNATNQDRDAILSVHINALGADESPVLAMLVKEMLVKEMLVEEMLVEEMLVDASGEGSVFPLICNKQGSKSCKSRKKIRQGRCSGCGDRETWHAPGGGLVRYPRTCNGRTGTPVTSRPMSQRDFWEGNASLPSITDCIPYQWVRCSKP